MTKECVFPRKRDGPAPKLQDFQVVGKLGAGTFGTVSRYLHIQSGLQYAIKIIPYKKFDVKQIIMTKKQIQTLYKIDSEYVVKLIDHFESQDTVYLITQYISGVLILLFQKDLFKGTFKNKVVLPLEIIAKIAYEICLALQEFFRNKIIHRDLKLENIILADGKVKIVDLGCSNYFGDHVNRSTAIGTKPYWCPQLLNGENQDDRLDIWCMAVILYQLVFLQSPFSQPDMFQKIKKLDYKFPGDFQSNQPQLSDFLRKCLTYKKDRLHAFQAKEHAFIKKYLFKGQSEKKYLDESNFEDLFDTKIVQQYRTELLSQIQRYKEKLKVIRQDNDELENMLDANYVQIQSLERKKFQNSK